MTSQKPDHLFDDFDEEIVYNEDEENVAAGKASVNKFLNDLKNKQNRSNSRKDKPTAAYGQDFPKRSGYGDIDLFEFDRKKMPAINKTGLIKLSPKDKEMEVQDRKITKESLLAGLPDRVKNIRTGLQLGEKEEVKEAPRNIKPKSPSPEPESLMIIPQIQEGNDVDMKEDESESSSSSESQIQLARAEPKRRMSFEMIKPLKFEENLAQPDIEEMGILQEPFTTKPSHFLPHFSNANDDIELERRKRAAKERRVMSFLYAGDIPHRNKKKQSYKYLQNDVNVGSDYTPEKEEEPYREQLKSPMRVESEESFKDVVYEVQESPEVAAIAKSEMLYDQANPLNAKISNRSLKDTVKSQSAGIRNEDRHTKAANLLERVKRIVEAEPMPPIEEQDFDIINEAASEKSSSRSIVESIQMSSDNSVAAPPSPCPGSRPDVV